MINPYANKTPDELMQMGRDQFDSAGWVDTDKPSPWAPGNREAYARAFVNIVGPRPARVGR